MCLAPVALRKDPKFSENPRAQPVGKASSVSWVVASHHSRSVTWYVPGLFRHAETWPGLNVMAMTLEKTSCCLSMEMYAFKNETKTTDWFYFLLHKAWGTKRDSRRIGWAGRRQAGKWISRPTERLTFYWKLTWVCFWIEECFTNRKIMIKM